MQVEKRDGSQERRIITGMIVDDSVLGRLSAKWVKEGLFASRWTNLIGGWCVNYYNRYNKAPGKAIVGLFESWARESRDKETTEIVERFLEGLSGEYEELAKDSNPDFVVDQAAEYFDRVRLAQLAENIQADLDNGDIAKAKARQDKFSFVEIGAAAGVDVLSDMSAVKRAFSRKSEPLIKYPGALGNFFKDALERDALISFMGPEKRGKTFWLLDIAWRAMMQGKKVAFFEVGDMSEGQIMLRFMTRASRRPLKANDPARPIKYPTSIDHNPDSSFAIVEHEDHSYPNNLKWKEAWVACEKILRKNKDQSLLRLSAHPNGSIGVSGMMSIIETWDRQGWGTPDVIVVDYADLLSPPAGYAESRDQINATWKGLRRISQEYHALVVTATQSNAESYNVETMSMSNFSEDKRKLAHVNGMVGINQTASEKAMGLQRLNWLVLRESEFTPDQSCHVAGCFAMANPAVLSIF